MSKFCLYTKIFFKLMKFSLVDFTQYRFDFLVTMGGSGLYNLGSVMFLRFVLDKVGTVAGWDVYDMILLQAVGQTFIYVYFFVTYPNVQKFDQYIQDGSMDFVLLKPINPIFLSTIRYFRFSAILSLIFPFAMYLYVFANKDYVITVPHVVVTAFSLLVTIALLHIIEATFAAINFWTVRSEFGRFFYSTMEAGYYPFEIFQNRFVRLVFFTVLPYALLVNVPFRALIGQLDGRLLVLQVSVLGMFLVFLNVAWRFGLRRYQSASS